MSSGDRYDELAVLGMDHDVPECQVVQGRGDTPPRLVLSASSGNRIPRLLRLLRLAQILLSPLQILHAWMRKKEEISTSL
jgi:hypothetical protein